jgi:hypothetical protein
MATKAIEVKRVEKGVHPPDGVYEGIWGGYQVTFEVDGIQYVAETESGIRTPRAKCCVTIKGGSVSVTLAEKCDRCGNTMIKPFWQNLVRAFCSLSCTNDYLQSEGFMPIKSESESAEVDPKYK